MVRSRLEYLLYAVALQDPDLLTEAERFFGGMLTNNTSAAERAIRLAHEFADDQLKLEVG